MTQTDVVDELLRDSIDIHMHTAPDVHPRSVDDVEAARQAKSAGMRAVLIKSHHTSTGDRAQIASKESGLPVFGAIALNHAVGGLNYHAVLAAIEMGAKEVWMPTVNAVPFLKRSASVPALAKAIPEGTEGISIVDEKGRMLPELHRIIELIARRDVAVGTGHISQKEATVLVEEAQRAGVKKIILTHPTIDFLAYSKEEMRRLAKRDVLIEHDYIVCTGQMSAPVPPRSLAEAIRSVGAEYCIMATDGGQKINPPPVTMFRMYISEMLRCGINKEEIRRMISENPARALGLER
ncbi:hypothetical protein KEJ39_03650 [Candidatus Bathyarchaeota archaeon]|nr:hypothetical protein [Candidatus Bathyarchaeota archaeon]